MNHNIEQKKSELKAIELLVPHIKRYLFLFNAKEASQKPASL